MALRCQLGPCPLVLLLLGACFCLEKLWEARARLTRAWSQLRSQPGPRGAGLPVPSVCVRSLWGARSSSGLCRLPPSTVLRTVVVPSSVLTLRPRGLRRTRPPCASPSLELAQTRVHQIHEAIQPSHPLSRPLLLPSVFPSIRVFSESALHITWPEYGSFGISPSNEYSELTSFRMDWLDLRVVQGTLQRHQFLGS